MLSRKDIISKAREFLGVPYKHQGRTRQGCDCGGLIITVMKELGYEIKDMHGYSKTPDGYTLQKLAREEAIPISINEIVPGDFVIIRFRQNPQHVALVTDHPSGGLGLLHSYESVGKVVEHRLDSKWCKRIVSAYRFKGVVDG